MRWTTRIDPGNPRRYNLIFHAVGKYDAVERERAALKYEGWFLGGCSTAGLWGFSSIVSLEWCTEEVLAGLVNAIYEVRTTGGSYDPHMVLCQVPAHRDGAGENSFFKLFRETIYPDVRPIFTYENRAHESSTQRLYYFDTDVMYAWLRRYNANRKAAQEKPAVPVIPNVGNVANAAELQRGTIIDDRFHVGAIHQDAVFIGANQQGQRPIAPGEYFNAARR